MPLPTLAELQPTLERLQGVLQNPIYHGEGDVAVHTRLVLEKLHDMTAFQAMDTKAQSIMTTAAALHDLGKVYCTRLEDGQWTSPHHGRAGASRVRELLTTEFGLCGTAETLQLREAVCTLIMWHMRPIYIPERTDPELAVRQMAAMGELTSDFSLRRLALLSKADCIGRICSDMQVSLQGIELFEEFASEQNCLDVPFVYPDSFSRFADLSGRNVTPGQQLFNDSRVTVTMLSGLPGTGKDTWYKENLSDLPMLSLDELRHEMKITPTDDQTEIIKAAREQAREYLRKKQSFVFNATNLSTMLRGKWLQLFRNYGAFTRIVYLEAPWDERKRRNCERETKVPENVVLRMLSQLEPPTLTEATEVEWICI